MSAGVHRLELSALDGANPLGFLAALGTVAALSESDNEIRLGWAAGARWTAFLQSARPLDEVGVSRGLTEKLRGKPVDGAAEKIRESAQKRFDASKKKLKEAEEALKKRKLRGAEREDARQQEIEPLEEAQSVARDEMLRALKEAVPSPELALGQRPDCTIAEYRNHALSIGHSASPTDRKSLDLLSAFGVEFDNAPTQRVAPTPFCFITGSGHQWFLDTARQLMAAVSETKVNEALFAPWTFLDEGLSMRWDPTEDVRYALRLNNPGPIGSRTVWLANLLAYRALTFFPCAPVRGKLAVAGWTANDRNSYAFTWPIWEAPLTIGTIRALVCHPAFGEAELGKYRGELRARGVAAIFRARRILVGNPPLHKLNFTPPEAQ